MLAEHARIFGIGLSRTGTLSLAALQTLGIETRHYPNDARTQDELRHGHYKLSILQTVRALTDIGISPFYAQLDEAYPDSRFILTTRETEGWLASVEKHFRNYVDLRREPVDDFVFASVYGSLHFSADRFRYVKELHDENVRRYFSPRLTSSSCSTSPKGSAGTALSVSRASRSAGALPAPEPGGTVPAAARWLSVRALLTRLR